MADSIDGRAREVTWGWWLVLLVGVLSVVAGVIILLKPSESLATLAVIAGIFFLLDGILELADSLVRSTPNRGLVALIGVLSAIAGVLLIRHPIGGVAAVALLIGIWLIAVGVIVANPDIGLGIKHVVRDQARCKVLTRRGHLPSMP